MNVCMKELSIPFKLGIFVGLAIRLPDTKYELYRLHRTGNIGFQSRIFQTGS